MHQPKSFLYYVLSAPEARVRLAIIAALLTAQLGFLGQKPSYAQNAGPEHRNIEARDFMDTFGVNIHLGENNYQNTQAIADALNIIGFPRVRLKVTNTADIAAAKDLSAKTAPYFPNGLKVNVLINGYLNAPDVTLASQEKLVPQIAGMIEAIEGPNEINNYSTGNGAHGPFDMRDQTKDFAGNYAAWATAIYGWKIKTPSLAKVKLLAPSIASGDPDDYAKLPDVSTYVNSGNFHFYAGNGRQPSGFGGGNFAAINGWYQAAAVPTKPVSVTEWGQTTASKPGQGGCDNATQAKYILNQMFDLAAKGTYRAYLYQLMDDTSDGDPSGSEGTEAHFGIFDYQWKVKPAAQALANIKNLLFDTSTKFTPKVPAYRVTGVTEAGAAGSSLTISKSDGSTFIVVWNEPQIWDQKNNAAMTPSPDKVTVDFGADYSYKVYDPLVGINSIATGRSNNVAVNLLGSPLLIQIVPYRP